jgi:tRNA uridine 5-carboxymethylaminomethyl modification enzyme
MALGDARRMLDALTLTPAEANRHGLSVNQDGVRRSAFDLLAYPHIDLQRLEAIWPELGKVAAPIAEQVRIDAQYAVYLKRQQADVEAMRRDEALELPADLDYEAITGLSTEVRQKLAAVRPASIAQAGRIDGITPAALMRLLSHVKRKPDRVGRSAA